MRYALIAWLVCAGCNADRPQVLEAGADQDVVTLPGGGALLVRRAVQPSPQCMARARFSGVFVPIDCDQARLLNLR